MSDKNRIPMTREEIRLQVAISVIQGVLEAKHGVIGEVVPSIAVAIALRIADAFVEEWYRETEDQPSNMTLEEAITHCEEKACGNTQCAFEHRKLAEWLKELQQYRKNARKEQSRAVLEKEHEYTKWIRVDSLPELFFPDKLGWVKSAKGVYGICMHDGVISMIGENETVLDDSYFISYNDLMLIEKESE